MRLRHVIFPTLAFAAVMVGVSAQQPGFKRTVLQQRDLSGTRVAKSYRPSPSFRRKPPSADIRIRERKPGTFWKARSSSSRRASQRSRSRPGRHSSFRRERFTTRRTTSRHRHACWQRTSLKKASRSPRRSRPGNQSETVLQALFASGVAPTYFDNGRIKRPRRRCSS